MRVLLVNPKPSVWSAPRVPPMGLCCVASALQKAGHTVAIWDAASGGDPVPFAGWDLVGATACTPQVREAWRVLERAKAAGARTVIGGPHATCLPDESLSKGFVDFVVRQEGEETTVALVDRLERGVPVAGLAGISWKRDDGSVVNEPDAPPVGNLDDLAFPAYGLLGDLGRYSNSQPLLSRRSPALPIMTSRGCPYACAFCYKGTFGRTFRARSPGSVAAEWELLVREHGAREIAVQDDAFNLDMPRAIAICREITRRGIAVPWATPNGLRADRVSAELMEAMRGSGCERVAFGAETGDPGIMASLGKHETLDQVREAFALARKAGLRTMGFFVLGHPGETAATIEATIRFAVELDPDWAQFTMATPYPGTRLREEAVRDGRLLVDDWDDYGHYTARPFVRPEGLDPGGLERGMRSAYRRFYLRPGRALGLALDPGTWLNLPAVARGAWHLLAGG